MRFAAKVWMATALVGTALVAGISERAEAQVAPAAAKSPRQNGTVKATTEGGLTLTTAAGDTVSVTVPATAKILLVAPGSKDLSSATAGTTADINAGDKAIVSGSAGDSLTVMTATRVILMKSAAIAQSHAADDAAWAQGGGGIVKSVDAAAGTVTVASGLKTITVRTTPGTVVRHYSGDSVRFADAQVSSLAAVKPNDQLRVRGSKSADGLTITADEMVAGTFKSYSGLLTAVDGTAGTVTLKDLTTKKTVTVSVTANSDVRRIPAQMAQMVAMRMKGATAPVGARTASASNGPAPAGAPPAAGEGRRAGADLSQMLSRLPTESIATLKAGDAVMIVATTGTDATKSTAVTLLAGVEAILTASPTGETTLTPWSVGGGAPSEGGGGGR